MRDREYPVGKFEGQPAKTDPPPRLLDSGIRLEPMFAMDQPAGAHPASGDDRFNRGPVPRMHQVRTDLAYGTGQGLQLRLGLSAQAEDPAAAGLEAFRIRTQAANGTDHMLEAVGI